jgi:SAM-dependent methyltransferase
MSWDEIANNINFNLEVDYELLADFVSRNHKIADLGCGYGRVVSELVSLGYSDVVGIDPSKNMIDRGKREFPSLSLSHWKETNFDTLHETFDAVLVCAVLTVITDSEKRYEFVNTICSILKPGGIVYLVEFCAENERIFMSGIGMEMRYSTPSEYCALFRTFKTLKSNVFQCSTIGGTKEMGFSAIFRKCS